LYNSIPLQFATKSIFCVISLKSALNVQQAHLRRISFFCLEAGFLAEFRLKLSYTTASDVKPICREKKPELNNYNQVLSCCHFPGRGNNE
jgi:hypothetical protein